MRKKIVQKILSCIIASTIFFGITACGDGDDNNNGGGGSTNPNASVNINIVIGNFGYGYDWIREIARVYESHNKDVAIKITPTVLPHDVYAQIEGGLDTFDMFFGTIPLIKGVREGVLLNLNNVYDAYPKGETKTVAEKLGDYAEEFYFDGEYSGLPYILSPTAVVVNYTTLHELFGANFVLPTSINTTDGFIDFCKTIRSAGAYAYIDSVGYTEYLAVTWFAQYDFEGYANYWNGEYIDTQGNKTKALNGESLRQQGKLEALKVSETLLKASNGFNHKYANSMTFSEAQVAFCGLGYGFVDTKKCVFMPNGAWLENEMKNVLIENPQDIQMIKAPVISAIRNVVPDKSIADDVELSALIKAIDEGSTSLQGEGYSVTQDDFDYVKRARSILQHNSTAHQAGIVATTKYPEVCEDFLVFLASDVASKIAASKLGGLTLPFGYLPSTEDGITVSKYVQSVHKVSEGAILLRSYPNSILYQNGLFFTSQQNNWQNAFINGSLTANKLYQDDITYFTNQWRYLTADIQ